MAVGSCSLTAILWPSRPELVSRLVNWRKGIWDMLPVRNKEAVKTILCFQSPSIEPLLQVLKVSLQ